MNRKAYLRRCVGISLRHRTTWVVMFGLGGLLLAVLLNPSILTMILSTVLAAGLGALSIALNSFLRHSGDPEAQQPFPS